MIKTCPPLFLFYVLFFILLSPKKSTSMCVGHQAVGVVESSLLTMTNLGQKKKKRTAEAGKKMKVINTL